MPDFSLAEIAGFEGMLSLPANATDAPVSIRLTDPLLYLGPGQSLPFQATITEDSGAGITTLALASAFSSPKTFAGGQLSLSQITV
jgi:hypothetical protein